MGKKKRLEVRSQETKGPKKPEEIRDPIVEADEAETEQATEKVLEQMRIQQEMLDKLRAAKGAEARVRIFARLMDTYGIDAIVSFFPALGDVGSSVLSGLYLLVEAEQAGLKKTDYLKIISLQAADMFVGTIPVAGDVADYFFKANKWSVPMFKRRTAELIAEARKVGVSEEAIAQITNPADKLPQLVDHAVAIHKATRTNRKAA